MSIHNRFVLDDFRSYWLSLSCQTEKMASQILHNNDICLQKSIFVVFILVASFNTTCFLVYKSAPASRDSAFLIRKKRAGLSLKLSIYLIFTTCKFLKLLKFNLGIICSRTYFIMAHHMEDTSSSQLARLTLR